MPALQQASPSLYILRLCFRFCTYQGYRYLAGQKLSKPNPYFIVFRLSTSLQFPTVLGIIVCMTASVPSYIKVAVSQAWLGACTDNQHGHHDTTLVRSANTRGFIVIPM